MRKHTPSLCTTKVMEIKLINPIQHFVGVDREDFTGTVGLDALN